MDQFTKLVYGRLRAQPVPGPHPAPELLSAFAENALTEADRGEVLQHLGACSECREVLFLALPGSPETQKVLIPQPRPFRRWGLTWGAAVATVAILGVLFTNRLEHKGQTRATVAIAPSANETKIAAETTPPELDQMHAARGASANKTTVAVEENEPKPQPQPKHMTGKMQPQLVFDQSGEVHVQAPGQSAESVAAISSREKEKDRDKAKDDKRENFAVSALNGATTQPGAAGKTAPSADAVNEFAKPTGDLQSAAGQQAVVQAETVSRPSPSALRAKVDNAPSPTPPTSGPTVTGSLGGVIVDPSGAAVGNAKVTTNGPSGAKTAISDSEGRFSFGRLSPGFYSIKAEANGFKSTEIRQLAVLDDKPSALQVTLDVGSASEVVEVTGENTVLESSVGLIVGRQQQDLSVRKAQQAGNWAGAGPGTGALRWTLSPEGAVQRSGDSGKSWQPVSVASGAHFRALSAVEANIWVGGKAGALYHSSNFGQTWAKSEPVAGGQKLDQDIVRLDFPAALIGTITTANGEVWTTSDGGQNWQRK